MERGVASANAFKPSFDRHGLATEQRSERGVGDGEFATTRHNAPIKHLGTAVAASAICLALVGCGSTAGQTTTNPLATTTKGATASNALAGLLPRTGELPGFTATAAVRTARTIAASVSDETTGKAADAASLKADGFREGVDQPLSGGNGEAKAIAYVARFSSAAGAAKYQTYLYGTVSKPGPETGSASQTNFTHFAVPGVPGALGSSVVSELEHGVAANVQWTEGDCTIELGDETSTASQPLSAPLISAAQAIYQRTQGRCSA